MSKIIINKKTTASHEVDPQKGFTPICPNELPVVGGDEIADELNRQSKFGRVRTVSKDVHPKNALWLADEAMKQFTPIEITDEPNVDITWNSHCMSGTEGAELIPGLPKITEYDFVVFKGVEPNLHPYSGVFHDLEKQLTTGLVEYYRSMKIDTVIVGGLAMDYCLLETAIDLVNCGLKVIVNLSATRAIGDIDTAMIEMKSHGIRFINSVNDLSIN